jgi:ABC-type iron transport system FetAB ATPase subunit
MANPEDRVSENSTIAELSTSHGHIPIVQTVHLTRVVADKRLVDDASIQVHRGDVVAIVGPSGAGKSSFLRLLNRLDEPTSGTVLLAGEDYGTFTPANCGVRWAW